MALRLKSLASNLRYAWAVLSGQIVLPAQIEGIILMAELAKTTASLGLVSASAERLLAKSASDEAALADAQATIANLDDTISQQIDAVTAKIDAVVPVPTPVTDPAPAEAPVA